MTELHQQQTHSGGDNIGRDKIINNYLYGSVDYQKLVEDIAEEEEDLREIPADNIARWLKKGEKLAVLHKQLEDLKQDVFRLYETFTRIPLNTERLRLAKAHFEQGEFREADALLNAEEMSGEVSLLKQVRAGKEQDLAMIDRSLEDKSNEFLIKAQLWQTFHTKLDWLAKTQHYFEQALDAARTAEAVFAYAMFLHKQNQFRESLSLHYEVLELYRDLAAKNPEVYLLDVATALNNLANLQRDRQEVDPARVGYEEALGLYRDLVERNPEVYLPKMAVTLNNLANLQRDRQEFDSALAYFEEALRLRRDLAAKNPEVYLPDVATTLNNLANLQRDRQEFDPARAGYEEALGLYRDLAEQDPEVYLPKMAVTLNNLAHLQRDRQKFDPARAGFEESLRLYRDLAEQNPEVYLPDMTMTLINLSIFYLEAVPDQDKSVALAREAMQLLLPIYKRAPYLESYLEQAKQVLRANGAAVE